MLQQGLESLPPLPPVVAAAAPEAAPPPAEEPAPRPLAFSELTEQEQQKSRLRTEADGYTIHNTVRIKQIRQLGGLPPDCDYEPPRPELLGFLTHGTGSNLLGGHLGAMGPAGAARAARLRGDCVAVAAWRGRASPRPGSPKNSGRSGWFVPAAGVGRGTARI